MRVEVAALTAGAPFNAGLVLVQDHRLVLTLNTDDMPVDFAGRAFCVGWVGGGQEPGETVWECALREAHEEVAAFVDLVPAPVTYFYDWEERVLREAECADPDPPLLFERMPRANPDVAPHAGLPAGPYLYAATFLALAGSAAPLHPGGDVAGLLLLPLELWPFVAEGAAISEAVAAGAEVIEREPLPPDARLWLHPTATIRVAVPLLEEASVRAAVEG